MFIHPPRGSETRRTATGCSQQQRCTHGPAGRGDELPVPRGEVGQARPRRSRGAAVGERAGPSGGAVPPPPRGGSARDPPSPARAPPGEARGKRGEAPPRRAWCGPARPYLPSIAAAARRVPPRPRALHGCRGSRGASGGRPQRHFPGTGGKRCLGSSRAAGPPRSRPSAPGVPSALGIPPGSMEGRPAAKRSARFYPAVRAL